jgi:hypothetical protein
MSRPKGVQTHSNKGHHQIKLAMTFALRLVTHNLNAFRSSHEVIDQCTNQGHQENEEEPSNFVITFRGFFRQTINKHPDPEDGSKGGKTGSTGE